MSDAAAEVQERVSNRGQSHIWAALLSHEAAR
jgi:hypothetical protein